MFRKLQHKWKLNPLQLFLVLCVFAIGGSLSGYLARRLMGLFTIDSETIWVLLYIIVVTVIWPVMVLLVSICFGQYRFFINYFKKMGARMRPKGGSGSN